MKALLTKIEAEVSKIAKLTLANVVEDVELLTVALSATGLHEIAHTLSYAKKNDVSYTAAHNALDIGWNPDYREVLVKTGYLANGVAGLLEVAKNNPTAGSRLMPVFKKVLDQYKDFGIPEKLYCELQNYMNEKLVTEGFAISAITEDGKIKVKTAEWVNKKACAFNK